MVAFGKASDRVLVDDQRGVPEFDVVLIELIPATICFVDMAKNEFSDVETCLPMSSVTG
jgi:hypothetical protein